MSSSIPSWQTLTAHAQPFRGARDLAFCLKVPLDSLLVWASSEGSGETARMRRLAWTFAARIGDKYQIRLARPICFKTVIASNMILIKSQYVWKPFACKIHLVQNKPSYDDIGTWKSPILLIFPCSIQLNSRKKCTKFGLEFEHNFFLNRFYGPFNAGHFQSVSYPTHTGPWQA